VSLHVFGIFGLGLSPIISAFLFLYVVGAPLGYSLDVLFAKRDFAQRTTAEGNAPKPVRVLYSDLGRRARWLARSFTRRYFVRFIVTVIIETLTGLVMLDAAIRAMDRYAVLPEHRLARDAAAAVVVTVVNFFLFGNILRFDWAYREVENPTMNIAVLAWLGVSMLVYSFFKSVQMGGSGSPHPSATTVF
jgi:hypothetical protein